MFDETVSLTELCGAECVPLDCSPLPTVSTDQGRNDHFLYRLTCDPSFSLSNLVCGGLFDFDRKYKKVNLVSE